MPSPSMEPTIPEGGQVFAESPTAPPRVGEIIVFHPPAGAERDQCGPAAHTVTPGGRACSRPLGEESAVLSLKRIVAGPGDEIYIKRGLVYRRVRGQGRFVRERGSFARSCGNVPLPECNFPKPIKIPAGDWFTMGDNRSESDDSRFWGPIPSSWIVARVRWCSKPGAQCAGGS
ncbi:MAG: signal peptidase I [Solirubrobacteraceae bacterium]